MYFLKIENTYDGLVFQEGKTFLSRKGSSADHGIGLSSVRKIIESHGGDLDLVPGEEPFLLELQWVYKHCSYKRTPLLTFA